MRRSDGPGWSGHGVQYGRTSKEVPQPDGARGRSNLFAGERGLSTAATPRDGRSDDGVRRPWGSATTQPYSGWLDRALLGRILLEGEHPLALSCFCGCPPIRINPKMVGNTRESLSIC